MEFKEEWGRLSFEQARCLEWDGANCAFACGNCVCIARSRNL
jgi:hypothetical protein